MASSTKSVAVKTEEKTTDEEKRETYGTRLRQLFVNEIGEWKANWVIECCAALIFFEVWVLLRLGCVSRKADFQERPVLADTRNSLNQRYLRRFSTYRSPSREQSAGLSSRFGRLQDLILESRRSISELLESSFSKFADINHLLKKKFMANKFLYQTESLIAQQSFSRVETVTVKRKYHPNFNRRIETFNPHADMFRCTMFRRKRRFALKSYTGVHKSLEKSGIVDSLSFCQAQMNCFFLEAYMLMSLDHPKIIKVVDVFVIDDTPCIVLELCKGGSLLDEVTKYGVMDVVKTRVILEQVCDALGYLHSLDVVHGDIKLENVMFKKLNRIDTVKLVDFGSIEIQSTEGQSNIVKSCFGGTLPYQAPEILSGTQTCPSKSSECWSVGVLVYVLLTGEFPFPGETAEEILQSIEDDENIVEYNMHIDPILGELVKRLLNVDPDKRPTMQEVYSELAGGLMTQLMSGLPETSRVSNDFMM